MKEKTCCFIGHRHIKFENKIRPKLSKCIEDLIVHENVSHFLLGSKSQFDDICHEVITELKENYPQIRRIYVRAEFPNIDQHYMDYLLKSYEETYFPKHIINAGKTSYIERNREMIDKSDFCIIYYDENYAPPRRKESRRSLTDYQPNSGTKLTYEYAIRKNKFIINLTLPTP